MIAMKIHNILLIYTLKIYIKNERNMEKFELPI